MSKQAAIRFQSLRNHVTWDSNELYYCRWFRSSISNFLWQINGDVKRSVREPKKCIAKVTLKKFPSKEGYGLYIQFSAIWKQDLFDLKLCQLVQPIVLKSCLEFWSPCLILKLVSMVIRWVSLLNSEKRWKSMFRRVELGVLITLYLYQSIVALMLNHIQHLHQLRLRYWLEKSKFLLISLISCVMDSLMSVLFISTSVGKDSHLFCATRNSGGLQNYR